MAPDPIPAGIPGAVRSLTLGGNSSAGPTPKKPATPADRRIVSQNTQIALTKPGLFGKLPSRLNTLFFRHPSLLLAVLLNLPGNSLLGGGGIGMIFGFARALSWPASALTIAVATAPVPNLFLMIGFVP